jgi:hypothetical protein
MASPDARRFDPLALDLFAFQFQQNRPYRNLCMARGLTPDTVSSWMQIPAVPAAAFKEFRFSCLDPPELPEAEFMTSGTTRGIKNRGTHIVPRLMVIHSAILPHFERFLLPDGARLKMLILAGSPTVWPKSSLSYMMETVRSRFGADGSSYFLDPSGLNLDGVIDALERSQKEGEPVLLLGLSLAFLELVEKLRSAGRTVVLPSGSRIMDTGGVKRGTPDIALKDLPAAYEKYLGIPRPFVVNEYGMTEMGSQFYDGNLNAYYTGSPPSFYKVPPPWVRTRVVDPETLKPTPIGGIGMLQHLDLANCGSVLAVLTEDLGQAVEDGFVLLGRRAGAEPRGCSLLMEELHERS